MESVCVVLTDVVVGVTKQEHAFEINDGGKFSKSRYQSQRWYRQKSPSGLGRVHSGMATPRPCTPRRARTVADVVVQVADVEVVWLVLTISFRFLVKSRRRGSLLGSTVNT